MNIPWSPFRPASVMQLRSDTSRGIQAMLMPELILSFQHRNKSIGFDMPRPRGLAKTGGRQRGTPNRKTHELVEKLDKLECDPIAGIAQIAMAPETAPELRVRCYAEMAQYVHAKRKAVAGGPHVPSFGICGVVSTHNRTFAIHKRRSRGACPKLVEGRC